MPEFWPPLASAGSAGETRRHEPGRFVAPRTTTGHPPVFSSVSSSMLVNSCATIRRSISRWAFSRFGYGARTESPGG